MNPKHNHAEAFALMKYASKDGAVVEMIWNSRDGVAPFTVLSKDPADGVMKHVEWASDRYAPDYPYNGLKVGDRIVVSMTEERARQIATLRADKSAFKDEAEREEAIRNITESSMSDPDIVVVDEKLLKELQESKLLEHLKNGTLVIVKPEKPTP